MRAALKYFLVLIALSLSLTACTPEGQLVSSRTTTLGSPGLNTSGNNSPDSWDKQYPPFSQIPASSEITLVVSSWPEAEADIGKLVVAAGGKLQSANNNNYYHYEPGAFQSRKNLLYVIPGNATGVLVKKFLALGTLQQYSTNRTVPELLAEISRKIDRIEKERNANTKQLDDLPIARSMLDSTLERLRKTHDSYLAISKKAFLSVTLLSAIPAKTPENQQKQEIENRTRNALGSIRSAISIYHDDNDEGLYPSDLSQLVANGKYLTRIPALELSQHKPSEGTRALPHVRDIDDLDSQLKDSGQWVYVADPSSPLFGLVRIDCTHTDSRGVIWKDY
jgi:type II secretory pathway pseudopilin PulG